MASEPNRFEQVVSAITRGVLRGARLGPGVLGNTATVNIFGLLVALGLVIALREYPWVAGAFGGSVILYLIYSSERAYRYAEKDPVSALLGGTEFFQIVRDQMSAKDKAIVSNDEPVIAAGASIIDNENHR